MPTNLLIKYNNLLEIDSLQEDQRENSLFRVFSRDIIDNQSFSFLSKKIHPTPQEGENKMEILFRHLTTKVIDPYTKKREFERERSIKLHWIKTHIDCCIPEGILIFSVDEPNGIKTYIFNKKENYIIVLEPLRKCAAYYLLTAFYIEGKDKEREKYLKKFKRRLSDIY